MIGELRTSENRAGRQSGEVAATASVSRGGGDGHGAANARSAGSSARHGALGSVAATMLAS